MEFIKCLRDTTYGLGGGKSLDFKCDSVYEVGADVSPEVANQMVSNRTAIVVEKPTKETLVAENKAMDVDENKKVGKSSKKKSKR